ncbi:hypothetical protein BRADI_2g44240v3 [Brachypodium distachyon]|uniref:F-box domain-containing protein n=1 Tax=Brachypodium distachyon TaxID=15368 RepID=A0A0Q3KCY3_BRADI|nr:hypothetical protein BRADI_2g44240v3 [Brachypodium distachyon]
MGLPALQRLMSMQRDRRHRQIQPRNGLIASLDKRKELTCLQEDKPPGGKKLRRLGPSLPEEIWGHIHSLLSLRDAARAACVSHTFLRSWRCHPNLTFRPGIEELALSLHYDVEYNFPCSILLGGSANSIRNLNLSCCVFRPMAGFSCLRSLTSLELYEVHITGDELSCLLSSSFALEELIIMDCDEIISLNIPYLLQRLNRLVLCECENLEVVKSKAPNLSYFQYTGGVVELSFGDTVRDLNILGSCWNLVHYARATLPQMVPNLEALDITSSLVGDIPVLPDKFLHLKHLCISFMVSSGSFCPGYDYLSLVFFLDACPSLETFTLCVTQDRMEHDSVLGDSSHLRQMPGHCHGNIKEVQIIGFCSAKSMVELTCHILGNAVSLQYLTLDTVCYDMRCSDSKTSTCIGVNKHMIVEAHKTLLAVKRYILEKVPSTVELKIVEPCRRCKAVKT